MNQNTEENITFERLGDLPEVMDDLEKAFVIGLLDKGMTIFSFIDQIDVTSDHDLQKALENHENETVRKFAKNLHPDEAKIVYNLLQKFRPYYKRIVTDVTQLLSREKRKKKK
jgi:hypothetical protein